MNYYRIDKISKKSDIISQDSIRKMLDNIDNRLSGMNVRQFEYGSKVSLAELKTYVNQIISLFS